MTKLHLGENCSDVCDDCDAFMTCGRDGRCGFHGRDKFQVCEKDVDCADGLIFKVGCSGSGSCATLMILRAKCSDPWWDLYPVLVCSRD